MSETNNPDYYSMITWLTKENRLLKTLFEDLIQIDPIKTINKLDLEHIVWSWSLWCGSLWIDQLDVDRF